MSHTYIIAEAGSNFNGDYDIAIKMIDVAKDSGCDAVKFQLFKSEKLYSKNTPDFAGYSNIPELIKSLEMPREWVSKLKEYCDNIGIDFLATPFDEEAVDLLVDLNVKYIKVAGFESSDLRFLNYVSMRAGTKDIPLIVSLGANLTKYQIHKIIGIVRQSSIDSVCDHYFLHVIQSYPTPIEEISLSEMRRIANISVEYDTYLSFIEAKIGLSDHTEGLFIPPIAVARGAKCIEKHFTLDRTMSGPDHRFAIEPNELKEMVKNIRLVERIMSTREESNVTCEKEFIKAKRSVVALTDIKEGETLTEDNITTKRPFLENCIPADEYYETIGKITTTNIKQDELIKRSYIK